MDIIEGRPLVVKIMNVRVGITGNGIILAQDFLHLQNGAVQEIKRGGFLGCVIDAKLQCFNFNVYAIQVGIPVGYNTGAIGPNG